MLVHKIQPETSTAAWSDDTRVAATMILVRVAAHTYFQCALLGYLQSTMCLFTYERRTDGLMQMGLQAHRYEVGYSELRAGIQL